MIVLTLPYPPSVNTMWRTPRSGPLAGRTMLSKDGREFRKEVAAIVAAAGIRKPILGRVAVKVQLYPHRPLDWRTRQRKLGAAWDDGVQCLDLDNANKALLDSLKGLVIEDDKWVRVLLSQRMEPDGGEARVVITIAAMPTDQPQQTLLTADLIEECEVPF